MNTSTTYEHILSIAEHLIQTRGFNAFSYRDIATAVNIKTASIHYHFPTKADLGKAVVARHIESMNGILTEISNSRKSNTQKVNAFFDAIFASTYLADKKMCLGGMLASDVLTVPEEIQVEVRVFFNHLQKWLSDVLKSGVDSGEFKLNAKAESIAEQILFTLEGALLLARLYQDERKLQKARKHVVSLILKR